MMPRNHGCSIIGTCLAMAHSSSMKASGESGTFWRSSCMRAVSRSVFVNQAPDQHERALGQCRPACARVVGDQHAATASHLGGRILGDYPGGEAAVHAVVTDDGRPPQVDGAVGPVAEDDARRAWLRA